MNIESKPHISVKNRPMLSETILIQKMRGSLGFMIFLSLKLSSASCYDMVENLLHLKKKKKYEN